MDAVKAIRLRLVVKRHPKGKEAGKRLPKRVPGRPPTFLPLLVALDAICRRGAGRRRKGEEGFFRPKAFKPGPRKHKEPTSERDALIANLAKDWGLEFETVEEYLNDQDRFY